MKNRVNTLGGLHANVENRFSIRTVLGVSAKCSRSGMTLQWQSVVVQCDMRVNISANWKSMFYHAQPVFLSVLGHFVGHNEKNLNRDQFLLF